MSLAIAILEAAKVLAPLIEELAQYILGKGEFPASLVNVPDPLKSRIAADARMAKIQAGQ
jgi:hypothetical protein